VREDIFPGYIVSPYYGDTFFAFPDHGVHFIVFDHIKEINNRDYKE